MRMFFPDGNGAAYNVAVPVPTATIVALEREYILKKLHPRHVEGSPAIVENYKQLVALGKKLDVIAYRKEGNVDAKELFKLLFEMKLVSTGSRRCSSLCTACRARRWRPSASC